MAHSQRLRDGPLRNFPREAVVAKQEKSHPLNYRYGGRSLVLPVKGRGTRRLYIGGLTAKCMEGLAALLRSPGYC